MIKETIFSFAMRIMNYAAIDKLSDSIRSADWTEEAILDALTDPNYVVCDIQFIKNGNALETVFIDCIVKFDANEVEGIRAPFMCNIQVKAFRHKKTGLHRYEVFFGSQRMKSGINSILDFSTEFLYAALIDGCFGAKIEDYVSDDLFITSLPLMAEISSGQYREVAMPLLPLSARK